MAGFWARAARALGALFFPPRCIFCGDVVEYNGANAPRFATCAECARRFARAPRGTGRFARAGVDCAAPFLYEGFVRDALLAMKTVDGRPIAHFLAPALAREVREAFAGVAFDAVVCVPKYEPKGRRYNQARVLARGAARELGLPLWDTALIQTRPKRAQHLLPADERARNVLGIFSVPPGERERLQGKTLLIVDDIITTGSTLSACAAELRGAGAAGVHAAAAAGAVFKTDGKSC